MVVFRFKNVCIESTALHLPKDVVTSAELEDRIGPLYERLNIPFGTLERLSGIKERRLWDKSVDPSSVATEAGRAALEQIGFDRKHLGALFNCSVTRDYFEPATACLVQGNLELPETTISMDITNACIGFSNGITMLGNLIESGVVKAGLLVSGENVARIIDSSAKHVINNPDVTRDELLKLLPTFTLGCGATAMVLCHSSIATKKHRIVGATARSAIQFNSLCSGDGDYYMKQIDDPQPIMQTESSQIINQASKLGGRMWGDFSEAFGWERESLDHIFCHQVGRQVNDAFYNEMTLDYAKDFSVYEKYGNLVSSALPAAFITGIEEKGIKAGERILLTAFGSGLHSIFTGIEW